MNGAHRTPAALVLVLLGLLASCGGGGGGGSGVGGGGGADGNRIPFTAQNAGRVGGWPIWFSEVLLRLGHVASQDAQLGAAGLGTVGELACSRGRATRSVTDTDGNGAISAGDRIELRYEACDRNVLTDVLQGTVQIEVLAAATPAGRRMRLQLGTAGLSLADSSTPPGQPDYVLTGGLTVETEHGDFASRLVVGDGMADRLALQVRGSPHAADVLHGPRVEKHIRYADARIELRARMRYESPELGGSFEVSTPIPLLAWLDTWPEPGAHQGFVEMRGAGDDAVRMRVLAAEGSTGDLGLELDDGGDGRIDATGQGSWRADRLTRGFLFQDTGPTRRGGPFSLSNSTFAMLNNFDYFRPHPPGDPLVVQFTRPPVATSGWRWALIDRGRLPLPRETPTEVAASVELNGARAIVRPQQPLRYSRRYELRLLTVADAQQPQTVRDAAANSLVVPNGGSVGTVDTPDTLRPVPQQLGDDVPLVPGLEVQLSAAASVDAASITGYQWTQVDGPALTLADADQPVARVRLAATDGGLGFATVRLSIRNAEGATEFTDLRLRTRAGDPGASLSRLRAPATGGLPALELWGSPAVGTWTAQPHGDRLHVAFNEGGRGEVYWLANLLGPLGVPLAPGRYEVPGGYGLPGQAEIRPSMDLLVGSRSCIGQPGWFDIHEWQLDGQGALQQLAVDFAVRCNGDPAPLTTGSVRVNSSRPMPD